MQVSFASGRHGGRIPAALLAAQCRQPLPAPPEGDGVSVAVGQVGVAWAQVGGCRLFRSGDTIAAMLQKLLLGALLGLAALLPAMPAHAGTTVAIGGALQDGTAAIWQRLATLVQAAPAGRDCWHVITIASAEPDEAAARVVANLAHHGARGRHLRVGPRVAGTDAGDARWADELRRCHGVYMTGGAQARLVDTLRPGGVPTPLLRAMQALWAEGGAVAGSSAGTAVLSAVMFRDAPDPLAAMKGRLREGQEWDRGFGMLPVGVVVDQHAVRRGRIARLLPLLHASAGTLGVAVEENSAAVFTPGGFEVLAGSGGGVLVVEPGQRTPQPGDAFGLQGATLHWLDSGDRFDLATRRVTPSPTRLAGTLLQPLDPAHRGYRRGAWYYADMLGDGAIVTAMKRLVDGDQRQLQGLAFSGHPVGPVEPDDPDPTLAFEWTLRLDAATRAWLVTSPEGYTVEGVKLDIVPVRLQRPLFRPLAAPQGR
jgi:cyanophycinase